MISGYAPASGRWKRNLPAAGDIAETEARLLLALDPLCEASYRWLMRALAAGGNPAQAARVFAACRRELRERAGMAPSAETERVFQEIAGR